ncbi:hypothetical protein [Nonlabens sp.]|uniref:hypothetical protein n=1 Tax=Nonlabens sp. TaxID=1888209 RepID=UPI003262F5E9
MHFVKLTMLLLQLSPHKTTSRLPGRPMEGYWHVYVGIVIFILGFAIYGRWKMKQFKNKSDSEDN